MKIPQIQIDQTHAKIGIESPRGLQQIEQPQAELHLRQIPSEMSITTTKGWLTIDQTEAWASMDIKPISRRIREWAAEGNQDVLKGMQRVASEGDELMRIENGGDPLKNIAKRNYEGPPPSFNIGFVPPSFSVKMDYRPGTTDIQFTKGRVENNTRAQKPRNSYTPQEVKIHIQQLNSIRLSVVNQEI
ncbi:hypothetical protein KP77_27110 [Jeotgalibacillus alimentarius]|uniref:Uncharacterized protein n=1 Tax=Jeotgalibacillus alimentarius TaxID=135826 RepID=A0A0C2RXU1_9BACL|nr:DUF6470 family protein [Jeotgalibacillus alimentarius]KIL46584.1 hypothetical protein KP77_27110 [Jeotgalibacillus alimentarius]